MYFVSSAATFTTSIIDKVMYMRKAFTKNFISKGRRWCRDVYETPGGTLVARTKHGFYPITRTGQLNRKHRYGGCVGDVELWEFRGEKRISIHIKELQEAC